MRRSGCCSARTRKSWPGDEAGQSGEDVDVDGDGDGKIDKNDGKLVQIVKGEKTLVKSAQARQHCSEQISRGEKILAKLL